MVTTPVLFEPGAMSVDPDSALTTGILTPGWALNFPKVCDDNWWSRKLIMEMGCLVDLTSLMSGVVTLNGTVD